MIQIHQTLPILQFKFGAAVNQLKHLHDKLDFANATGSELDIIFNITALYFALDHSFHFAHGFKSAVIDVLAKYKWTGHLQQLIAFRTWIDNTRFNPGITLPFTPMLAQIFFQGRVANGQRRTIAPGTEAHIHPEYKTIRRDLIQQMNQFLSPQDAKLLHINTFAPIGFTLLIEGKNQVDITGKIEFLGAEFAHRDDNQILDFSVIANRLAILGSDRNTGKIFRRTDAGIGKIGEFLSEGNNIGELIGILPDPAKHQTSPQNTHCAHPRCFIAYIQDAVLHQLINIFPTE